MVHIIKTKQQTHSHREMLTVGRVSLYKHLDSTNNIFILPTVSRSQL